MTKEIIHSDLSYKIVGLVYEVYDRIGYGQSEKIYCDSLAKLFGREKVKFQREYYCPIIIEDEVIARRYFDFLIEDKVVLEVKVGDYKYKEACSQLFRYLKQSGLKLGLVVRFTSTGARVKRIVCFY